MIKRTIIEFTTKDDIWNIVETWSKENDFNYLDMNDSNFNTYQKGKGFLVAPMMLAIEKKSDTVHLEAWIRCNFAVRLFSFFILPAEMGIESGGLRGVIPRNIARTSINKLLENLRQPLIK